jgi:DNA-binding NarL/FixJ family response regulator
MIFDDQKIEGLIAQRRLSDASAVLTLAPGNRRARAAVAAVAGDDRALARLIEPALLVCRNAEEVAAYFAATNLEPAAYDHLVAGTVLTWSSDADGAYVAFRAAHDRAITERSFHVAVAARERLAHHALLFGNVEVARDAIEDAIELANTYRLSAWLLRCLAVAARLALDAGDLEDAGQRLTRGNAAARSPEERALFAPTGAQLAVEKGDDSAVRGWTGAEVVEIALSGEPPEAAGAATIAVLIAAGSAQPGTPGATALRRALLQSESAANAVELFAIAARYGDLEEARFGAEALAAVFAPSRPYLHAHQLLARAHLLVRTGDRSGSIDSAGDAARAFSAMGLRRWTNEAMRLLVAQEPPGERRGRGRPSGSTLTEREEQVAHLIRRGARNREVAVALQISEHTVERHVSSILGRLGLRSRWQIVDPAKPEED